MEGLEGLGKLADGNLVVRFAALHFAGFGNGAGNHAGQAVEDGLVVAQAGRVDGVEQFPDDRDAVVQGDDLALEHIAVAVGFGERLAGEFLDFRAGLRHLGHGEPLGFFIALFAEEGFDILVFDQQDRALAGRRAVEEDLRQPGIVRHGLAPAGLAGFPAAGGFLAHHGAPADFQQGIAGHGVERLDAPAADHRDLAEGMEVRAIFHWPRRHGRPQHAEHA